MEDTEVLMRRVLGELLAPIQQTVSRLEVARQEDRDRLESLATDVARLHDLVGRQSDLMTHIFGSAKLARVGLEANMPEIPTTDSPAALTSAFAASGASAGERIDAAAAAATASGAMACAAAAVSEAPAATVAVVGDPGLAAGGAGSAPPAAAASAPEDPARDPAVLAGTDSRFLPFGFLTGSALLNRFVFPDSDLLHGLEPETIDGTSYVMRIIRPRPESPAGASALARSTAAAGARTSPAGRATPQRRSAIVADGVSVFIVRPGVSLPDARVLARDYKQAILSSRVDSLRTARGDSGSERHHDDHDAHIPPAIPRHHDDHDVHVPPAIACLFGEYSPNRFPRLSVHVDAVWVTARGADVVVHATICPSGPMVEEALFRSDISALFTGSAEVLLIQAAAEPQSDDEDEDAPGMMMPSDAQCFGASVGHDPECGAVAMSTPKAERAPSESSGCSLAISRSSARSSASSSASSSGGSAGSSCTDLKHVQKGQASAFRSPTPAAVQLGGCSLMEELSGADSAL